MLIPNSNGEDNRPLWEFNSCHNPKGPGGGRFCSAPDTGSGGGSTRGWKPSMTPAEADEWAKNSLVKDTLYFVGDRRNLPRIKDEGFDLAAVGSLRRWGDAVYLGMDTDSRDFYLKVKREAGKDPGVLRVRANVQRPLVIDIGKKREFPKDIGSLIRLFPPRIRSELEGQAAALGSYEAGFTKVLQGMGYDSLLYVSSKPRKLKTGGLNWNIAGGNQLVVFDPEQVTVVGEELPGKKKTPWKPIARVGGGEVAISFPATDTGGPAVTMNAPVTAWAFGGKVAAHPAITIDWPKKADGGLDFDKPFRRLASGTENEDDYTITHVPTGFAIAHDFHRDEIGPFLDHLERNLPKSAFDFTTTDVRGMPKLASVVRGAKQARQKARDLAIRRMFSL